MQSDDNNSDNNNNNNNNTSKAIDCEPLSSDTSIFTKHRHTSSNNVSSQQNNDDEEVLFNKLEQENARLPPQVNIFLRKKKEKGCLITKRNIDI